MTTICMKSFTKLEQGKTLLISGPKNTGKTTFATILSQTSNPEKVIVFNEYHWLVKLPGSHFQKNEKTIIILDVGPVDSSITEYYLYISKCFNISFIYITEEPYPNRVEFDFIALAQTTNISVLRELHTELIGKSLDFNDFIQLMQSMGKFEFLIISSMGIIYWGESVPERIRIQRRCKSIQDELYLVTSGVFKN